MRRLGVVALSVVLLSGCAAEPPTPADPDVSPSPTAETVARPASLWDITCDELLPAATVDAMVGPAVASQPYPVISELALGAAAIRQVGGIACAWAEPGSFTPEATVTVLPDSGAAFAEFATLATTVADPFIAADYFDGLLVRCGDGTYDFRGHHCDWVALSDGVSVTASFLHLGPEALQNPDPAPNPDTSLPPAIPAMDGSAGLAALGTVFDALAAASTVELEPLADAAEADCANLTTAELASVFGLPESDFSTTGVSATHLGFPYFGYFQEDVALGLIGATSCGFETSGSFPLSITVTTTPGLGWVLAYSAQLSGHQTTAVGELGTGALSCTSGEDRQGCTAAVESDGVLFGVGIFGYGVPPLTEAQAIDLLSATLS